MGKYIVTIDTATISLSCKQGSFTFANGSIIEDSEIARTFPRYFKELAEEKPVAKPAAVEVKPVVEESLPADLVTETYENEPTAIEDEPVVLEPASLVPVDVAHDVQEEVIAEPEVEAAEEKTVVEAGDEAVVTDAPVRNKPGRKPKA